VLTEIEITDQSWQVFTRKVENATIFHSVPWIDLLCSSYGYHPMALVQIDSVNKITAGIPVVIKRNLVGKKSICALPFTDHCRPLALDQHHLDYFSRNLSQYIDSNTEHNFEFRWKYQNSASIRSRQEYVLHNLPMTTDFNLVARGIHDMHKRNVNLAQKNGVTVITGSDEQKLKEFYRLHLITRKRKGVPIQPWEFFRNIKRYLLDDHLGTIFLAYQDSRCLAAAVILNWNDKLVYKYGASDPECLHLRANNAIFWEVIKWGCANGFTNLDFGRTDTNNQGLRDFKSRWGAVEQDLFYSYAPAFPSARPAWLMTLLSQSIVHSPLWLCRILGELSYRFIS